MNEKILRYLKEFSMQLQKELQNSPLIEEFFSRLEEEGLEAQLDIDFTLLSQNKSKQNLPIKTKISFKSSNQSKPQFVLTIEDLDFLRSLGIEPLKKEKSTKK